jgi:hypothetical protein
MDQILHLHEFFVEGNNPEESHVLLNITEPSTPEEQEKGYFFVICEINNGDTKYIASMQSIVDEIENSYYEIPDQVGQSSLEVILNKINQENINMIQPDISLHCIIGAIRKNDIIFSFYGHPQMLLFYKAKDGSFKKMDLVEENKTNEQTEHAQLFSQLVQGKIGQNDLFFAGTPTITSYFNHDRLQKIITTRTPKQSSEHLQKVLSELQNNISFGGIIINLQTATEPIATIKTSPVKKGGSAKSLKSLFSTERNTADILSPSFLPKFQERINETFNTPYETAEPEINPNGLRANTEITSSHLRARQDKIRTVAKRNYQETILLVAKFIWKCLKFILQVIFSVLIFIGSIFSALGRNIALLFFAATNYQNRRHNIILQWKNGWQHFKDNIARLPLITKFLLSASLILIIVFSNGIIYIKNKQKKEEKARIYSETKLNINNKYDQAESSLVYANTDAALTIIAEAKTMLATLSCETPSEKTNCQTLKTKLENLEMKARKITLATPQLLADWSATTATNPAQDIFFLGNKIYGFSAQTSDILLYDLLTKETQLITPGLSVKNFISASVPKENDFAVLLYDNQNIVEFKPTENSWKKVDIGYPGQNTKITGLAVYNRRLYTLDAQNNKIYRHDTIQSGFSIGKEWTQNNTTNLNTGTDITIDGDVFVLGENGTIFKFTKGQIQNFVTSKIDPPLTAAHKIWTYNDLKYIYILDSTGKRIIIMDKLGQIKNQITAKEFTNPTGMIIDEEKNIAYILDSNKLYQVGL